MQSGRWVPEDRNFNIQSRETLKIHTGNLMMFLLIINYFKISSNFIIISPVLKLTNIIFWTISFSVLWRIYSRHCWAAVRWARSSACATQQYCGSVSFMSAHGPLLYNACAGDVTQVCSDHVTCVCNSRWRQTSVAVTWRVSYDVCMCHSYISRFPA
jgi:hypothetical protein